jgi:hypothetical protein
MRSKLNLTDREVMDKSWIALQLEMADYPSYDPKGKKVIRGEKAIKALDKYL